MKLLFCTVAENYFMENYFIECMEKKKKEQLQGIKNSRRLVIYPTIQLVIVNVFIKYEVSILYHCGDILEKKCGGIEK